jgi:hypothetical protein
MARTLAKPPLRWPAVDRRSLRHRKEVQGSKSAKIARMVKQAIGIFAIALALPAFAQQIETVELAKLAPDVAAKLTAATITLRGDFKTDAVYKVICGRAGLDVIFDPSFEPQTVWVDFGAPILRDAPELVGRQLHTAAPTLLEALELVRRTSHTAWRVVTPHTIVVVPVPPPPKPKYTPRESDPLVPQTQPRASSRQETPSWPLNASVSAVQP